jgi:hypothetical protein
MASAVRRSICRDVVTCVVIWTLVAGNEKFNKPSLRSKHHETIEYHGSLEPEA